MHKPIDTFNQDGYTTVSGVIPASLLQHLSDEVHVNAREGRAGIRQAETKFSSVKQLVFSDALQKLAREYLPCAQGEIPTITRVIVFDKTPDANWSVAWHQDKTLAVDGVFDAPGWGPWSVKGGVHHVQPPVEVLNSMVTLRVHIDACDADSGCLHVLPKSHLLGACSTHDIAQMSKEAAIACPANLGDILVMRPLLMHASYKAQTPSHRRIVHIEYANITLPQGGGWA